MYGSEVGAAYYLHAYELLCGIKLCYLGGGGLYAYLGAEVYLELIRGVAGLLVGACFDYGARTHFDSVEFLDTYLTVIAHLFHL